MLEFNGLGPSHFICLPSASDDVSVFYILFTSKPYLHRTIASSPPQTTCQAELTGYSPSYDHVSTPPFWTLLPEYPKALQPERTNEDGTQTDVIPSKLKGYPMALPRYHRPLGERLGRPTPPNVGISKKN